ncbi:hypothetical protein LINPERHAP1_LOCUS4289, partial [Linum perenne]
NIFDSVFGSAELGKTHVFADRRGVASVGAGLSTTSCSSASINAMADMRNGTADTKNWKKIRKMI